MHLDRRSCIFSARNGRVAVRCRIAGGVAAGRGAAVRSRRSGLRFSIKTRLRLQPALPLHLSLVACNDSPTPANPLSSLTALPVPPLNPFPIPDWMRHRFVSSTCFFPFVIVFPLLALPELAGSAYDTPDWKRTSPSAGEEGGRPGTHESTFAGAAGLATPRFTSVVLCGSERRARCSPRACLASGTGKLRVGRHRPDDRGADGRLKAVAG